MSILTTCSLLPIKTDDCRKYTGIAFDGCFFYLTSPQSCLIDKLDACFESVETIETCRGYTSICYDERERCFWAVSAEEAGKIFKLDRCFCEVGCIYIEDLPDNCSNVVSIAYDCKRDILVVAFPKMIIEITKKGCGIRLIETPRRTSTRAVLMIPPYYVAAYRGRCHQFIGIYDCDGQEIKRCKFPRKYIIEGLVFYSCWDEEEENYYIYALAAKHCRYPYIVKLRLDLCYAGMELEDCSNKRIVCESDPEETE
ncbi:hypothetical protein [Anaerospora sp.]|uniref:hypothetical protein n=1 Tax=Anaerospora sp. TaxID=1960278 RepID=UPI00289DD8D2|nr:hypothetical protein [Anaerospora sp.]